MKKSHSSGQALRVVLIRALEDYAAGRFQP